MAEYTQNWFVQNIPLWEEVFKPFAGLPLTVLEIGSFEGRATVWLLENILTHKDSKIVCIDPYKDYPEYKGQAVDWAKIEATFHKNIEPWKEKVEHWKMESIELRKTDRQFDIIYVDGDHTSSQCLIDAVLSHILLKKGGYIIFDDYFWKSLLKLPDTPKAAIDAFMDCFADLYEPIAISYQVILRKK